MYCEAQALSLSNNYIALYREAFLICSCTDLNGVHKIIETAVCSRISS